MTSEKGGPFVLKNLSDAERRARLASCSGVPFFIGERLSRSGKTEYLVAPLADFKRFHEVGWLLYDSYGEERDPAADYCAYVADNLEDALLEAALRIARVRVPTVVASRPYVNGIEYLVAPEADLTRLEAVGWTVRERSLC